MPRRRRCVRDEGRSGSTPFRSSTTIMACPGPWTLEPSHFAPGPPVRRSSALLINATTLPCVRLLGQVVWATRSCNAGPCLALLLTRGPHATTAICESVSRRTSWASQDARRCRGESEGTRCGTPPWCVAIATARECSDVLPPSRFLSALQGLAGPLLDSSDANTANQRTLPVHVGPLRRGSFVPRLQVASASGFRQRAASQPE